MTRLFPRQMGEKGATAVEFALVMPLFLMFLGLLIDGARMLWTQQALQEVAFSTARCSALSLTACANDTAAKSYAVSRAARSLLTITGANVVVTASATCGTGTAMRKVAVDDALGVRRDQLPARRAYQHNRAELLSRRQLIVRGSIANRSGAA